MTSPARRSPLAISAPAMELNDIHATRSPSRQPRLVKTLATRLALRFSAPKSMASSPQITAGLSGWDSAWLRRKSAAMPLMLGSLRRGGCGGGGWRRLRGAWRAARQADRRRHGGDAASDHDAIAIAPAKERPRVARRPVVIDDARGQGRVLVEDRRRGVGDRLDGRPLRRVELPAVDLGQGPVPRGVRR